MGRVGLRLVCTARLGSGRDRRSVRVLEGIHAWCGRLADVVVALACNPSDAALRSGRVLHSKLLGRTGPLRDCVKA